MSTLPRLVSRQFHNSVADPSLRLSPTRTFFVVVLGSLSILGLCGLAIWFVVMIWAILTTQPLH